MRRHRLLAPLAFALLLALALTAARATTARADVSGELSIVGPWQGSNAASFRAVLAGFTRQHPAVTVTYRPATGDVATALQGTLAVAPPDLAVLSLPADRRAMADLFRAGNLQPIGFAAATLDADYAFSWKELSSVDGKLTAVPFKATDRSAFWYDPHAFAALGLSAPSSWHDFLAAVGKIRDHGLAPFAISGGSRVALPSLFENLYLAFQGNRRYDRLAAGTLEWNDASVASTLTLLKRVFGAAKGPVSLDASYTTAVRALFGSPMKAYMVPGGSAVLPIVQSSVAMRPPAQFGTFAFPRVNAAAPPRAIGDVDAVVMVKDSPAARALIGYLASPDAARIWAQRGGDFLSPNRKVVASDYSLPQVGKLAQELSAANVFRFGLAEAQGPRVSNVLAAQLANYLAGRATRSDVMSRLLIAAGQKP